MSQLPPPLGVADVAGRKKRAGLPKLLHKFFFKVLRLRPTAAAAAAAAEPGAAAFEAYDYGYRMVDEFYHYYSYGGAGSTWGGVLSSIPEESSEVVSPDATAATLRKAYSESEQLIAADASAVDRAPTSCRLVDS
ncbi:hypothetical protein GUJ93_ZPchr0002g24365 [Zizania palustris]|uniref:Uncharacterized protein n=1 Tax=Zizania palustris TaxID=103762 RepID=A0A8J5VVW6_ZIZPA|nr:hypothetical protein GUJ93_ZPchr0002g24365 [Zizania palustris]